MNTPLDIDGLVKQFKLASRELFNHYFRIDDPYNNDGWSAEARFSEIEEVLFEKLVLEPAALSRISYGDLNPEIQVVLRMGDFAPIRLNREVKSGYWDYPLKEVMKDAKLPFICFFDWDQLDYRDNRYARIQVAQWPHILMLLANKH